MTSGHEIKIQIHTNTEWSLVTNVCIHYWNVTRLTDHTDRGIWTVYSLLQGDSLGGVTELLIISHAIIYRRNWNLASTYLDRRGDSWVTEAAEIGRHRPTWRSVFANFCNQHGGRDCNNSRNGTNQAGRHRVSVLRYTVFLRFVYIVKLLYDLQFLIRPLLRVKHPVPLQHWAVVFESLSGHGFMALLFLILLSCVGRGLVTGWSPFQGVLSNIFE
jgi:hypothetical protein